MPHNEICCFSLFNNALFFGEAIPTIINRCLPDCGSVAVADFNTMNSSKCKNRRLAIYGELKKDISEILKDYECKKACISSKLGRAPTIYICR